MDIYEQIVQLRREGRRGALATIINVQGSIPSFETAKINGRTATTVQTDRGDLTSQLAPVREGTTWPPAAIPE